MPQMPTAKQQPKRSRKLARSTKANKPKHSEATLAGLAWLRAWEAHYRRSAQRCLWRKAVFDAFDHASCALTLDWIAACVEHGDFPPPPKA